MTYFGAGAHGAGCLHRWRANGNGGLDHAGHLGCGWNSYTALT